MSLISVDLPLPETPVIDDEAAQRKFHGDVFQIVLARAPHDELLRRCRGGGRREDRCERLRKDIGR